MLECFYNLNTYYTDQSKKKNELIISANTGQQFSIRDFEKLNKVKRAITRFVATSCELET